MQHELRDYDTLNHELEEAFFICRLLYHYPAGKFFVTMAENNGIHTFLHGAYIGVNAVAAYIGVFFFYNPAIVIEYTEVGCAAMYQGLGHNYGKVLVVGVGVYG